MLYPNAMSTIQQVVASESFVKRVIELICSQMIDKSATPYDSEEGFIEGRVTDFTISDNPAFGELDGEGTDWQTLFKGEGDATVGCKTPDGEYRDYDISGPFDGIVEISLPEEKISSSTPDELAEAAKIVVTIESSTLKDQEPFDESILDQYDEQH